MLTPLIEIIQTMHSSLPHKARKLSTDVGQEMNKKDENFGCEHLEKLIMNTSSRLAGKGIKRGNA